MNEHIILIGAYGWLHPQWDDEFYPDDLPTDWKIGYYGNEYPVVVVPNTYWPQFDGQCAKWLEDCDETLQFVCEWPPQGSAELHYVQAQQCIDQLGERMLAVLVPINRTPNTDDWQRLATLAQNNAISLAPDNGLMPDLAEQARLHLPADRYGFCWNGEPASADNLAAGPVAICSISGTMQPKALRVLIETMIKAGKQCGHTRPLVLFAQGEPPELQLLTNAGIILDLL